MERIAKITLPLAIIVSVIVVYLFLDLAGYAGELQTKVDGLSNELDQRSRDCRELNKSLLNCTTWMQIFRNESEDYYNKWQAERTIAYAIWQLFDSATNITWEGQEFTQVNIIIPREQWDYLRNLSETYRLHYEQR